MTMDWERLREEREGRKKGGREGKMKAIRVRRESERERDHLTHDSIRRGRRVFLSG